MKTFSLQHLPRRTLAVPLAWLVALLLFVLGAYVPWRNATANLEGETKDIQRQIKAQNLLQPIYRDLQSRNQKPAAGILPMPERGTLSREMVSVVSSIIGGIAGHAALETVSVTPDLPSLAPPSRQVLMHAVLRGDLTGFRKFFLGLGELPYLEKVEAMEIRHGRDFLEFRIQFRLALGQ